MTPRRRKAWSLAVAGVLATPTLLGCFGSQDCFSSWNLGWESIQVEPWHTRADFRLTISMTEEVAGTDTEKALRGESTLMFGLFPGTGDVSVGRATLASDGYVLARGDGEVSIEDVLADCERGRPCTRELDFWAGVAGEGTLSPSGSLWIPGRFCTASDGIRVSAVHLGNSPSPPPVEPPPPEPRPPRPAPAPVCSSDQFTCVRGCSDGACVNDCLPAIHDAECLDCILDANWRCALEWCGTEVYALTRCRESLCSGADPCPDCDSEREAFSTCEAAHEPDCRDASDVCF